MRINGFVWLDAFVEKLDRKHGVTTHEVEAVFIGAPYVTRIGRGQVQGEDVYRALGQTEGGRYLAVFFVLKQGNQALVISARDMERMERREYERHR